mgnify:CR=1 FL=1
MNLSTQIIIALVFLVLLIASFFVKAWIEKTDKPTWRPNGESPKKMYSNLLLGTSSTVGGFRRPGWDKNVKFFYECTIILGIPVEFSKCYAMEVQSFGATYKAPNMQYSSKYKVYGSQPMNVWEKAFMIIRPLIIWGLLISVAAIIVKTTM